MSEHEDLHDDAAPGETLAADVVAAGTARTVPVPTPVEHADDDDDHGVAFGWTYLAVLFGLFGLLAVLAYSCDDDTPSGTVGAVTTTTEAGSAAAGSPAEVIAVVDGDQVTLSGSVPDEGARRQLVELAEARYGEGNVIDELTIDETTTLDGGSFSVNGAADDGDDDPLGLQADATAALGLAAGDFDVAFTEVVASPVDAEAAIAAGRVTLSGVLPDQASADALIAATAGVWGAENVDSTGLSVGDATWDGGVVRVTGAVDAGDVRGDAFTTALAAALAGLDPTATVDSASLTVDTGAEALARAEELLRANLEANPILFASGSAEIDPASDEILTQAAAAINAAPGIAVEIVGHTDDQGGEAVNQTLSASRAQAVLDRLVELGVEATRLTSRGAGESEPVADNTTEEGRAANRRIAFEFQGAA